MARVIPVVKRRQIAELAETGQRMDGRSLTDYREITIKTGVIEKANGSATCNLGKTQVLAGVKYEIGDPFPDTPNDGVLSVSAEFVPIASPDFEPGPPNENAIELARVVDRGLRESKILDTSKLCLVPGKKVWIAWVDIYILDHGGNLIDAAALAALSALLTSTMPKAVVEGDEIKILDEKQPVPLRDRPVTVTLAKIGDKLFVDPTLEEEEVMDCRLSVNFTEDGKICAMQKGEAGSMTFDEITRAVETAKVKSQWLRKYVPPLVKTDG